MMMVPFIDLANHRVPLPTEVPCFPVELVRTFGDECVVLRAPRDLRSEDEVLITYCYDGNSHLLLDYGFAEEARAGQLGSEALWLDSEASLEVVHAGFDDLGLERTVAELARRRMCSEAADADDLRSTSVGLHRSEVRAALVDACEAALARMPTTLEADRKEMAQLAGAVEADRKEMAQLAGAVEAGREEMAQLAGAGETEETTGLRRATALTYRAGQKALLLQAIEVLRRGLDGMHAAAVASPESRAAVLKSLIELKGI